MHKTLSIRELTRSGKILLDYDYIDIEDAKSHQYKGVFIPEQYAGEVKEFLEKKLLKEKEGKKKAFEAFAGIAEGDIGEQPFRELKKRSLEKES